MDFLISFKKKKIEFLKKENIYFFLIIITIFFFDRITKIEIINNYSNGASYINDYINLDLIFFFNKKSVEATLFTRELKKNLFFIKLLNCLKRFTFKPISSAGSMPTSDRTEYLPPIKLL